MKKSLVLIGGGGHCRSCIDIIEMDERYEIVGVVDKPSMVGQDVLGYPVIGTDDDIANLAQKYDSFFITLGQIKSPKIRIRLFKQLKALNVEIPSFVSPFAHVSKYSNIGDGTIIHHNAVVNASATVGDLCIINTAAVIEHDVVVGDFCHISTSVMLNGAVTVGNGCFVGSNASLKDNISIGENSFIGFHCRVTKDLEPDSKILFSS